MADFFPLNDVAQDNSVVNAVHILHDHPFFVKERKYGNVHFTFFEAPQQEGQSPVPGNDPDRMQEM